AGEPEAVAHLGKGERVPVPDDPRPDVGARPGGDLAEVAGAARRAVGAGDGRQRQRGQASHGRVSLRTVSLARTRALIESAAVIARPTAFAPGIWDLARMLSCWRSVSVSRRAASLAPDFPQATMTRMPMSSARNGRLPVGERLQLVVLPPPGQRGWAQAAGSPFFSTSSIVSAKRSMSPSVV